MKNIPLLLLILVVMTVELYQDDLFNVHLNWALFILLIAAALGSSKEMNYEN